MQKAEIHTYHKAALLGYYLSLKTFAKKLNLHNYFNIHVFPSLQWPLPFSHFRVSSCSEFQKPSQTAAEQGEAELRILNFKTTWSEF